MSCHYVRKRLSAFCDDELRPPIKRKVSRHLKSCSKCREEIQALRSLDLELQRAWAPEPSPGFLKTVMQGVQYNPKKTAQRFPRWAPIMLYSLTFASVFLLGLFWELPTPANNVANSTSHAWVEVLEEEGTMHLSQLQDQNLNSLWSEANETP